MMRYLKRCLLVTASIFSLIPQSTNAQENSIIRREVLTYKETPGRAFKIFLFSRPNKAKGKEPLVMFLHGWGLRDGAQAFFPHCIYLAKRGVIAATMEYRPDSTLTSYRGCVSNTAQALSFLEKKRDEIGIDPDKMVLAGGSGGGLTALGYASRYAYDHDDRNTLADPKLLILFNPAVDITPWNLKDCKDINPLDQLEPGLPSTLIMIGTADHLHESVCDYVEKAREKGISCLLKTYLDKPHGFFNYGRFSFQTYRETVNDLDTFLVENGILKGQSNILNQPFGEMASFAGQVASISRHKREFTIKLEDGSLRKITHDPLLTHYTCLRRIPIEEIRPTELVTGSGNFVSHEGVEVFRFEKLTTDYRIVSPRKPTVDLLGYVRKAENHFYFEHFNYNGFYVKGKAGHPYLESHSPPRIKLMPTESGVVQRPVFSSLSSVKAGQRIQANCEVVADGKAIAVTVTHFE